jgi:hypothetical protein
MRVSLVLREILACRAFMAAIKPERRAKNKAQSHSPRVSI